MNTRNIFRPTAVAGLLIATAAVGAGRISAQESITPVTQLSNATAKVFYACYVPGTGTVYRIKEEGLPTTCASQGKTKHVEFSWTDGDAAATGGPAGGDLSGTFPSPNVVGIRGRTVASTAPTSGQFLGWSAAQNRWEPMTVPSSGAFTLPYKGERTSTGSVFEINQSGTGIAGRFTANSGTAVSARSLTGPAVWGTGVSTGAVGVRAEHSSMTGTALEVLRGKIKVNGAGKETDTAVFWVDLIERRIYSPNNESAYSHHAQIDHPMLNGNPNAFVFVTMQGTGGSWERAAVDVSAVYNSAAGKWQIRFRQKSGTPEFAVGKQKAQVLVVVP